MGASALEAAPTEELDELEKLATDYVTAYIENIYLDGGNDLSKATVAELAADAAVESSLSLPMDQQVLVGRSSPPSPSSVTTSPSWTKPPSITAICKPPRAVKWKISP